MSKAIQQPQLPQFFYFLVTGTLCVSMPPEEDSEDQAFVTPTLNVVIKTEANMPFFGMQAMADSHNALQMRYRKESGDAAGSVVNVVINSVFPMGLMTEEEYNWRKPVKADEGV